jgi:hypothetical protein
MSAQLPSVEQFYAESVLGGVLNYYYRAAA